MQPGDCKQQITCNVSDFISFTYSYAILVLFELETAEYSFRFAKIQVITSLAKEVMFLVALVCSLFVCLSVCGQHYSKSYERIGMTFYGKGPG